MEQTLSLEFLRVVERAAVACAASIGHGRRKHSDQLAVEAMRKAMETVRMDGTIVIGEGERDEAPMLYIGEKVGMGAGPDGIHPAVDIAVDPLEGTNLCATGAANAIAVLAATEKGGLLHAPDLYMEKLVVGPSAKGKVSLDAPVQENLDIIAKSLDRRVSEITVSVLDRERHAQLIADIRKAGARIQLIGDGDLSAAISAAVSGTGIHAVMGTGGAPEGVLSAAALKCLNGEIQGRLKVDTNTASREKAEAMGVDFGRIYLTDDLCPGKEVVFAACGVTDGNLLQGVRHFGHGVRTSSLILTYGAHQVRFIDTVHIKDGETVTVRF
ncbi:class II fructose-bisphosphatase [Geothrix sp. 21YS21S-4]|uniref:class II fructose-bisphosphatase n=1 Tax=Geothrix sp. 21YS21S-4 TaxID=3068889 RepID=UPI0027BAE6A8|nr:class II fructose-bisphosphatase [Geothrix sp. 21YS21S-4]